MGTTATATGRLMLAKVTAEAPWRAAAESSALFLGERVVRDRTTQVCMRGRTPSWVGSRTTFVEAAPPSTNSTSSQIATHACATTAFGFCGASGQLAFGCNLFRMTQLHQLESFKRSRRT